MRRRRGSKLSNKKIEPAMRRAESALARSKEHQVLLWEALAEEFEDRYERLRKFDDERFLTPVWEETNEKLEGLLLPKPPFNFLRDPVIGNMMFVDARGRWLAEQYNFLHEWWTPEELTSLLEEDPAGDPKLAVPNYGSSHNSVHHLYHLTRFGASTQIDVRALSYIVEWGGGYGNLAKMIWRANPGPLTYISIDTPLFCCLQWLYLSTCIGEENVHLVMEPDSEVPETGVILLPVSMVEMVDLETELFISTWALSESSEAAQDHVMDADWFKAEHLLLAYMDEELGGSVGFPSSIRLKELAEAKGAHVEPLDFIPGNYYAFL